MSARGRGHGRSVVATLWATAILLGPTSVVGQQPSAPPVDPFGLGRPASAEEIATLDIDVMPDGTGLPAGSGTAADGAVTWVRACRGCHGSNGEGGTAAPLVGRDPDARPPTVGNYWPYATTLYDYINRAMPRPTPGTLSPDEVYGLVAWILSKNDIIGADTVVNAESLPGVVMPARDRFVPDNRAGGAVVRD
ncbi:MAG: cytochrome c [Acidobacteriota bacterium]|nr:cytochrome c [Acidobacteriota bacterium]